MVTYKTLNDVPTYYKGAVQKAVNKGALQERDGTLNVSEDMCRILSCWTGWGSWTANSEKQQYFFHHISGQKSLNLPIAKLANIW